MSTQHTVRRRRKTVLSGALATGLATIGLTMVSPGSAGAVPVGKIDAGVPFSSVVYGTGCLYDLTVDVNASGPVTFWERKQGYPERFIGAAQADGAIATIRWVPRRIGDRLLYAKQAGVQGPVAVMRVHQGYGSGWACFAL